MSLLEVLISIFVLSIGLLGVAAMIPVGRFEILEGAKADQGAVVGRAALREVKVRGLAEPFQYAANGTKVQMWSSFNPNVNYAFVDPYYLSQNSSETTFPPSGSTVNMPRVDVRTSTSGSLWMKNTDMAEQVFVWHDDLQFNVPDDRALRPQALINNAGTRQQFAGNYSWAAMVKFDPTSNPANGTVRAKVSIPVFYKRNLTSGASNAEQNGERVATVTAFGGGGIGGGDVTLTLAHEEDAKRLRDNYWLMLIAQNGTSMAAEWYRVVAAAQENGLVYRVTLSGPDWDLTKYSSNVQAVLIEGVVNVFTQTIDLSEDVLRAP